MVKERKRYVSSSPTKNRLAPASLTTYYGANNCYSSSGSCLPSKGMLWLHSSMLFLLVGQNRLKSVV